MDLNNLNSKSHLNAHQKNRLLSSSELGDLFANYLGDSLYICVFKHHLTVVDDDEVRTFVEFALEKSEKHLQAIKKIYETENIPLPVGFGEQDLIQNAPRLFSDLFMVFYITEMTRAGLLAYGSALSTSYRKDIIDYFKMCIQDTTETYTHGVELLLSKGFDISTPKIPYPKKVDFVERKKFISMIAGKERPLTAIEIKQLQININTNTLGKALMLAFSQVASSDKLRKYFSEGAELAQSQVKTLSDLMFTENLPSPKILDEHVTDSTISPFSDKLMLYHTSLATAIGIGNYGMAISNSMRHDIHAMFVMLTGFIGKFGNKGMNLMIEYGWFEEPPTNADREKLMKREHS